MIRHLFYSKTLSPVQCLRQPNHHRHLLLLLFSTSHRGSNSVSRRQWEEEESRQVRVSVWWDFENCGVPSGFNVFRVAGSITSAVRSTGIKGPVEITAFGDVLQLSRSKQEGLSSTGINLAHIPRGGKNSTDRSLLVSLMHWVSQNPPPAHIFLISGDRDFASTLHRLRMSNYNILLATPESAHGVLCSAASIMWNWKDLLHGESVSAKYFNQPPDSPHSSWYGRYKVPLLDPFAAEETSERGKGGRTCRSVVPEAVVNQICAIVESKPEGIAMAELRNELVNSGSIDREYYGHKKFIYFLMALQNVVKLKVKDSHYTVLRVGRNFDDYEDQDESFKESEENNIGVAEESAEKIVETLGDGEKVLEMDNKPEPEPESEKQSTETAGGLESSHDLPHVVAEKQREASSSEEGSFGRFWTKLFRGESSGSDNSQGIEGEVKSEAKHSEKDLNPPSSSEALSDDKPVTNIGLLERVRKWFKSSSDADITNDLRNEIFSQDSFWSTLESFMDSAQGLLLVSESRSREQMACEFRSKGPECLHALNENDLLHLVDLLISDKKWVEEFPSENFPFKLTHSTRSQSSKTDPKTPVNSLSSLFKSQSSQPGKKRLRNLDKQGKNGNTAETPVAQSREEVLSDCRDLLNEILKEHPKGYSTGSFRKHFSDRYGYQLDVQKLGYLHLVALLRTFPGVKIKSGYIVRCDKALSEQESFRTGLGSVWEELGPIARTQSSRSDEEVVEFDLEPAVSESESSDSDETRHINITKKPEFENDHDNNNNNNSLLGILDSWHCRNEGSLYKNKSDSVMQEWNHRSKKSYSFVLDSGSDDENSAADKLANGVLGNLGTQTESSKIGKDKVRCE